jgi:hypothetical protein
MAGPRDRLEVLANVVRHERDAQIGHFESLDSKAGLVLGFAGTLVALASSHHGAVAIAGQGLAALAAGLALWAFLPRRYPVLELAAVRDLWTRLPAGQAVRHIVDTEIEMVEQTSVLLGRKSRRIALSLIALALAVAIIFASILVA